MKIQIEIPEEFEVDFKIGCFSEFFERISADISYSRTIDKVFLCGKYEKETADMFKKAFAEAKEVEDT